MFEFIAFAGKKDEDISNNKAVLHEQRINLTIHFSNSEYVNN